VYDPDKNDGFTVRCPNNVLYIDYELDECDPFGFDIELTDKDIKHVLKLFKDKFGIKQDWKLKVLYFYNGGCAGLSEVE